jgi:hypothetical protein
MSEQTHPGSCQHHLLGFPQGESNAGNPVIKETEAVYPESSCPSNLCALSATCLPSESSNTRSAGQEGVGKAQGYLPSRIINSLELLGWGHL